jgi:hypothetical protein
MALTTLVLSAGLLYAPAMAQTPSGTINAITPYSWPEFKADYGLPAAPTVPDNSAQADGTTTNTVPVNTINLYPLLTDQQVRAYLLGDYGTTLPPAGSNNFLDLEAGSGIPGLDALEAWAAPFYSSSTASNQPITVDDDNLQNVLTYFAAANTPETSIFGAFGETVGWQAITAANVPPGTQNYYADSYQRIPAVSRYQEDSGDNGISPNYARWVPYVANPGLYTVYAYFPSENLAPASGNPEPHADDARYQIFIELAGQQTPTEYTVTVNQTSGGTWVPLGGPYYFPQTSTAAPTQFNANRAANPPTIGLFAEGEANHNPGDAFVEIRVDDTTNDTLTSVTNQGNINKFIVADAIELRGSSGITMGTPVSVNITAPILQNYNGVPAPLQNEIGTVGDYKEIALGYGGGSPGGDGKTGGLPISYIADFVTGTGTGKTASPGTATTSPQYYAGNVGYEPINPAANGGPVTTGPANSWQLGNNAKAIDQVTYFTRTESINTDPNNPLQTTPVGFLYCANAQTGDIIWRFPNVTPTAIGDTDTTLFTPGPFGTILNTDSSTSFNGENYRVATATTNTGAASSAVWQMPTTLPAGRYYVYVWYPAPAGDENRISDARYTVTTSAGVSLACNPVNQQINGGSWVQLAATVVGTNSTTEEFDMTPGSASVSLSNLSGVSETSMPDVAADAVEFVPVLSMGTTDSTPAVVRNMRVYDVVSNSYVSRTVVLVTDNSGKMYCVDAAGNGDGNDVLEDSNNNTPVFINGAGVAYEDAAFTIPAVLPLHPTNYGTTSVYWIWQPNTAEPESSQEIINVQTPTPSTVTPMGTWTDRAGEAGSYAAAGNFAAGAAARGATPTTYFTYSPVVPAAQVGATKIFVWDPGSEGETHITDAEYTVVEGDGVTHTCIPVDQTSGTGAFVPLQDAITRQTTFTFSTAANTPPIPGFASTPNTIVLDNTTANGVTGNPVVVADAIELVFSAGSDANSNLIGPLAFGQCSPTVHVTKNTGLGSYGETYGTYTTTYDYYNAKIYAGNSNGVLYALDGAGAPDGLDPLQRDLSQDSAMPSPSVDWWFNVGVTSVDSYGEIIDQPAYISESIAGTPAYWHNPNLPTNGNPNTLAYDQILFTTYSPQGNNSGRLYSVNAQGPVGYYGTDTEPDATGLTDYRLAAGLADYNLSPIPFFSFPDAYGEVHLPNRTTAVALAPTDHITTALTAPISGVAPAAYNLGDAAGSPVVFGGMTVLNPNGGGNTTLPYEAYFAANDPTTDGSPATEGRIWGVNLGTGTVDENGTTNRIPYIYPTINPSAASGAAASLDPNYVGLTDVADVTEMYNTLGATYGTLQVNATQFGPFTDGPLTPSPSGLDYYVSSSPAVGIVHTIPSTAGTLTDTLTGSNGYPTEYGGAANAYDIDVPMLYVGDLDGVLHSINLAGYNDVSRFIQDSPLDGTAIVSTPALLVNGNGADISATLGNNAGGTVFVNSQSGAIWQSEAFPFEEIGLQSTSGGASSLARNVDFEYGGPGGFSSVSSSSFNIDNFQFTTAQAAANSPTYTITAGATPSVDTSEWIYASGDNGFTYGLTPQNTSLGNGGNWTGAFDPGYGIQPGNEPPLSTIPLNRNFFTSVFATNPITGTTTTFDPKNGRPPENLVFDWGQTVYIVIYGLDDPNAGNSGAPLPTADYPRAINVTFTIGPYGSATNGAGTTTKVIDLQSTGAAVPITQTPGVWPPPGYVLTSQLTGTSEQPAVGDYAAVYAYQLGNGTNDPQTPGSKIAILSLRESAQYYSGTPPTQLVTTVIGARSTGGTVIREANGSGTGYTDVAEPAVDQATFSILNPIAIRSSGRSMGQTSAIDYNWYNLALASAATQNPIYQLGPFSGVPAAAPFSLDQPALTNGNSVPQTAPVGGTETAAGGGAINPNDPTASQTPRELFTPIIMAVAPGMISHGTDGNSATADNGNADPTYSSYNGAPVGPAVLPNMPSSFGSGDYGQSMLDIADRSALGTIYETISNLKANPTPLAWQDNSGAGGALSVVNPLPWEAMPTTSSTTNSGSVDYPDIGQTNASIELLPRSTLDSAETTGSDSVLTNSQGTLANSSQIVAGGDPTIRTIYPNAAMVRVNVPLHQPANLESYYPGAGAPYVYQTTGATRLQTLPAYVGKGYVGSYRIYVNNNLGARSRQQAYRTVQVWTSVPADTSTSITQPTIDIGNVPAGYGIDLLGANNNSNWSPLAPNYGLAPFYQPITIVNNGNVNLLNLHLDQYVDYYANGISQPPTLEPNAFGSYTSSGLSTIPSFDVSPGGTGLLTSTPLLPIVRSSLDYFNNPQIPSTFNTYIANPFLTNSATDFNNTPAPGVTAHKALVGDTNGAFVTVPDVPHANLPNNNGYVELSGQPYGGRPQISIAVPVGTPVGSYTQTVTAFEGFDPTTNVYTGPTYGSQIYSINGWEPVNGVAGNFDAVLDVLPTATGTASIQTQSSPGTTLKVNVVESPLTDVLPLTSTVTTPTPGTYNAALPGVDNGPSAANSNDLQPWAFYDPAGNAGGPTYGLLWTSARKAPSTSIPYSLFSSSLVAPNNLLNVPTNGTNGWWSAATQLTENPAQAGVTGQQSYGVSTFGTLTNNAVTSPINSLFVTSDTTNSLIVNGRTVGGQTVYSLNVAPITYTNNQPVLGSATTLFTSTLPIFSPRASYYYSSTNGSSLSIAGFIPTGTGAPGGGTYPLVVYYTKVGGRSQLMYWPAESTENGQTIVAPAAVPMPAGMSSTSTPTIVARPPVTIGTTVVPEIDLVFGGVLGSSGRPDIFTARYSVIPNTTQADGTVTLQEVPTLPAVPLSAVPAAGPTMFTQSEALQLLGDGVTWQARDIAWYRDLSSFEMDIAATNGAQVALIPAANPNIATANATAATYDRASGQWVFSVNWTNLLALNNGNAANTALLNSLATWWTGAANAAAAPNVTAYVNPNSGTVTFNTPLPTNKNIDTTTGLQFSSLSAQFNPMVSRMTFQSQSNTEPIAFIDDQPKPNAAPGQPAIVTARYWYIYRKQTAGNGNGSASSAVLYYNTRRLTVVLNHPIQLTTTNSVNYTLSSGFDVKIVNGPDITNDVDVDWARGRIYFPEYVPNGGGILLTEGQSVVVTYSYTNANGVTVLGTDPGVVTWTDEPLVNTPTQTNTIGEHVVPINTPANESDPSAFLDPLAGTLSGGTLVDDPSTATPASPQGQPYAHKVWLFWTSLRNAKTTNGTGSDVYWETLDPRFEVINP